VNPITRSSVDQSSFSGVSIRVKKKFLLAAFAAILLSWVTPLRAADAAVRVFVLKHKRVEEAALLIRPHLSDSASVTLTQRLNAMTVTDREENLSTIARVIAGFDVPPRGFTFAIKLVRARADVPAGSMAQEIGGLGAKLKSMFQFKDYALIDSAVLQGLEGHPISYKLGEEYVVSFSIGLAGAGDELMLSPFALSRVKKNEQGRLITVPLYRTAIPVTLNQTLVLGASREEASKNALILILLAQEMPRPGAGEKTSGIKTVEKK
jgi:hypothetical protein